MYLINNKPTVNFAPFVDLNGLLALKPYLDYAVVKSSKIVTPSRYFKSQFLDQKYLGINDVINQNYDFDFIQDLKNNDQLAGWLRYYEDVVYGQQSIQIYYPKNWNTKHLASEVIATENVVYWDKFFQWLKEQNIFQEYGRVVVFLNEPGVNTPTHQDSTDHTRKDEFIWLSLGSRKNMFVYDPKSKIKHYITSPIGTFDATNYHGADSSELASWSMRIDGIFTDDF